MSCWHLLHPGGHALSSSTILLWTDRCLWSLWRPPPGPNGDQTPCRPSKRILPLFRVPPSPLVSPLVRGEQQTSSRRCHQYHQSGCDSVLLRGSAGPPQPRKLQAAHPYTTQRYGWRHPRRCGPPSGQPSSLLVRILPRHDLQATNSSHHSHRIYTHRPQRQTVHSSSWKCYLPWDPHQNQQRPYSPSRSGAAGHHCDNCPGCPRLPQGFLFLLHHLQHGQGHRHWGCRLRLCFL